MQRCKLSRLMNGAVGVTLAHSRYLQKPASSCMDMDELVESDRLYIEGVCVCKIKKGIEGVYALKVMFIVWALHMCRCGH